MTVLIPPRRLAEIPDEGIAEAAFPHRLLPGCESVLLLFCAGLYGRNDGYWVRNARIRDVTGIDIDAERLEHMRSLYPRPWTLQESDCFTYQPGRTFDLVCVDPPTLLTDRAAGLLSRWCDLANKAVVLGLHWKSLAKYSLRAPLGWEATELIKRADHRGGTYWLVLERV